MTNCTLFGISVRSKGYSLLALTPFFMGIGIALKHPGWVNQASAQTAVVRLDVAVIDKDGRSLADLTREEFTIYEDGVKHEINSFNNQESPVSLGIVIDSSGSARSYLQASREIALKVISQMKPDDEAFIMQFRAMPSLVHGFTSDQLDLVKAIDLIYTSGQSAILDAINAASEYTRLHGKFGRRGLLTLSDGQDNNSTIKEGELLKRLIENDVQAHFIRYPAQNPPSNIRNVSLRTDTENILTRLAMVTGGQLFPPSNKDQALKIAAPFMENLRRQYELTYISMNNKTDDKLRKIKVVVTLKNGRQINATTRQSYYGPGHKIMR